MAAAGEPTPHDSSSWEDVPLPLPLGAFSPDPYVRRGSGPASLPKPVPHDRPFPPDAFTPRPAPPDAARDARVAARRAADARKAGRALDRYMTAWEEGVAGGPHLPIMDRGEEFVEAVGDYVLSRLHHNRHYGVPFCPHGVPAGNIVTCVACHPEDFRGDATDDACSHGVMGGLCGRIECQVGDGR